MRGDFEGYCGVSSHWSVSNVITQHAGGGGSLFLEPFLFLYHLQCDGISAGVESVPEAALLTLCIVPFSEGESTGRQTPPPSS